MIQAAKIIGRRLATIGLIRAGVGIGVVFGALILGVAINPSLRDQLFSHAILGFAFAEATGLFALMMAFLLYVLAIFTSCLNTLLYLGCLVGFIIEDLIEAFDYHYLYLEIYCDPDYNILGHDNEDIDWEIESIDMFMDGAGSGSNEGSLSLDEQLALSKEMSESYQEMNQSLRELRKLTKEHNISLLVDSSGLLSVDLPSSISDADAENIINKVQDLDNKYNVAFDRAKDLSDKDKALNKGDISEDWEKMGKLVEKIHKDLYRDDD